MLTKNDTPAFQMAGGANNTNPTLQEAAFNAGTMEGLQAKQAYLLNQAKNTRDEGYLNLAKNKDVRDEKVLGMEQEAFSWKRDDRNRQQAITAGMAQAAQEGGYQGVIDYLITADPEKAMDFTNKKLALDQNMMKTDTMKSLAPAMQSQALLEGYGILGHAGLSILNAPDKDQAGMYQQLYPIISKVNPDASPTFDQSAIETLMIAAGQADPKSQLLSAENKYGTFSTNVGKLAADFGKAQALFGANDPRTLAIKQSMDNEGANAGQNASQIANLKLKMQSNIIDGEDGLRKEWDGKNKEFNKLSNFYQSLAQAVQNSDSSTEPQGPNDIMTMYYYAHMLSPQSTLKPGAMGTLENMAGIPDEVRVKYNQVLNGQKLSPEERDAMLNSATAVWDANKKSYDTTKSGYQDIATTRGYDPQKIFTNSSPLYNLNLGPNVPADLVRTAEKYVAKGMPPEQANQLVQQIMAKKQQMQQAPQAPQGTPNGR